MDLKKYLTPYKLGHPVITGSGVSGAFDERGVDCPFVFRHNEQFYMMYTGFDGKGYQTGLAKSSDLLNWQLVEVILKRGESNGWDSLNAAGSWILREHNLYSPPTLKKWQNKYWMLYHSYPGEGYESGPARLGLAWTDDNNLLKWNRLDNPILCPEDGEDWESGGLYKECLLEHEDIFYMFYNAKNKTKNGENWEEQIGLVTSKDLIHWKRCDNNPVLRVSKGKWDSVFVADPCVLQDGKDWAMYYYGYNGEHAQNGIAFSDNLIEWEKYPEPILRVGQLGDLDSSHAHKPSVICHENVLYQFYCACRPVRLGDKTDDSGEFRCISVAASVPYKKISILEDSR